MGYKDKNKQSEFGKLHYINNKDSYRINQKKRRESKKIWFAEIKKNYCCLYCGEQDINCIDFHHYENNKKFTITDAVRDCCSEFLILEEIKKCITLCANCHRMEHLKNFEFVGRTTKIRAQKYIIDVKNKSQCECGESRWQCLDFHHIDENKKRCISDMAMSGYAIKTIQKEIDKCIIICSNCHRKKHNGNKW